MGYLSGRALFNFARVISETEQTMKSYNKEWMDEFETYICFLSNYRIFTVEVYLDKFQSLNKASFEILYLWLSCVSLYSIPSYIYIKSSLTHLLHLLAA